MKVLVVDLQSTHNTKYREPNKIGLWFLGRRIERYALFINAGAGKLYPIELTNRAPEAIQATVDNAFIRFRKIPVQAG